ncbi:28482_t:CDS:2, partial [Gigaspora margarita]
LENNGNSSLIPMGIGNSFHFYIRATEGTPISYSRKCLEVNRRMNMKALEFLIKNGLDRENEFLGEIGYSVIKLLKSIFMDEDDDMHNVVKKYTEAQRGVINLEADSFTNKINDSTFIQEIQELHLMHMKKLDEELLMPSFVNIQNGEANRKFDEELKFLKRELEKREFEKICKKIEKSIQLDNERNEDTDIKIDDEMVLRIENDIKNLNGLATKFEHLSYTLPVSINEYDESIYPEINIISSIS